MSLKKGGGRLISKLIIGFIETHRVSGCSSVCPFIRAGESRFRSTASFVCSMAINWVAVKELRISYYIGETLLFTIYTHYGNLI